MTKCTNHHRCIESALELTEKVCKKNNLNFTSQRKSVFKLIWDSHVPIKAYDILSQFQKEDPDAKPITIYRSLDFLIENGIIHKIESQNSYMGCTHPGAKHNCYFTICSKCNLVTEECDSNLLNDVYNNLAKKNFIIKHVTLEIHGLCKNCSN